MRPARVLAAALAALTACAGAQTFPDPGFPDQRPELRGYVCPARDRDDDTRREPLGEAERLRFETRARYREYLPAYLARVGGEPAASLLTPVAGVSVAQIAHTFGAPRWDRSHEGIDIFAPRWTPVIAAASGWVYRITDQTLGGLSVTVIGDGGVRYYYTHLEAVNEELREGQYVDVGHELGYVGNDGNAAGTPTHLHFGVYVGEEDDLCEWNAIDPLPLLIDPP
ncbi:MAG TPA: M23 family metallopeptidase [Trueperaceae bacterium]|mgnify:CR=1 FL=1|nr:M23 family metallopeptidase [Trueperaceae bacterium]